MAQREIAVVDAKGNHFIVLETSFENRVSANGSLGRHSDERPAKYMLMLRGAFFGDAEPLVDGSFKRTGTEDIYTPV